jgi:hypothetical protein
MTITLNGRYRCVDTVLKNQFNLAYPQARSVIKGITQTDHFGWSAMTRAPCGAATSVGPAAAGNAVERSTPASAHRGWAGQRT